jgi:TRAP-type C4-dicarboxylate transport system permease small subunit
MEKVLDIVGAVLCAVLCYYGVTAAIVEYVDETLPDKDLRIDNWYMMVTFALAFALLTIEFLLRVRRAGDAGDKAGF